jgi:hypothetical protein
MSQQRFSRPRASDLTATAIGLFMYLFVVYLTTRPVAQATRRPLIS